MTPAEEAQAILDNYAALDVQPIKSGLYSTVSLRNGAGENQTGMIIIQKNQKYIMTLANSINAISGITQAKNANGDLFPVSLKGTNNMIALYQSPALDRLLSFRWYDDSAEEGLSIYAVGDQTDTFSTLLGAYTDKDLDFSVTEGFIERLNSPLSPSWGNSAVDTGPYIRHSAITNPLRTIGRGGSFGGPLFAMKQDVCGMRYPALIGMNIDSYHVEAADPSYIGISFALGQADLQQSIQIIVG